MATDDQAFVRYPAPSERGAKMFTKAFGKSLNKALKEGLSLVSREHMVSLIDQAVVSGTTLLTSLFVARWSDPSRHHRVVIVQEASSEPIQ